MPIANTVGIVGIDRTIQLHGEIQMQVKKMIMASGQTFKAPERIKTVFVANGEIVKTNRGTNLFESGPNAYRHMQSNHYGADYCEILDADNDRLLMSWKRNKKGQVIPHLEWNPEATEQKFGVSTLLEKKK
jgi:hypothetical protein